MMNRILSGTALMLLLGAPLAAQDARFGVAINLAAPTGAFDSSNYSLANPVQESYNSGAGVDFLACVPLDQRWALRFNLGLETFDGTASPAGGWSWNIQDQMISIGAVGQFFLEGNANRQSGTYLLAGPSLDFESFSTDNGLVGYDPFPGTVSKTRVGAVIGIGHTFRSRWSGGRYLIEGSFHKTLTNDDSNAGDPPAADFLKFNFGFLF